MNAADTHASRHTLTLRGPRVVFGPRVARTDLAAELNLLPARRALLLASPRERKARADVLDPRSLADLGLRQIKLPARALIVG